MATLKKNQYFHSALSLLLLLTAISAQSSAEAKEEVSSYRLPITRHLKTKDRLAFNFWNGEYPSPIIDLKSTTKGETTIRGYLTLRDLDKMKSCTILNGIYHPWSKTPNSVINFYTLNAIEEYDIHDSSHFQLSKEKAEARLIDVIYLAEGACKGKFILNKVEKVSEFTCSDLDKKKLVTKTSKDEKFDEQWLQLKCKEGGEVFVKDTDLLKVPGAQEGSLLSYGKVGPAKED